MIRLQTGVTTFTQLVVGAGVSLLGGVVGIVGSCQNGAVDCVTNAFVSLILVLAVILVYGALFVLGYFAQERRGPRLAYLLIACEVLAALILLFDAKHATSTFDRIANLILVCAALAVILSAWRQLQRTKRRRARHTARDRAAASLERKD